MDNYFRKRVLFFIACISLFFPYLLNAQFILKGEAVSTGNDCYRITPAITSETGAIWFSEKIDLTNSFDLTFDIFFGTLDQGADGMAFALQPNGNAIGGNGGGLGIRSVIPSFVIEFDTYSNVDTYNDPDFDHLSMYQNGDTDHSTSNALTSAIGIFPDSSNVEDNDFHKLRIIWDVSTLTISVYVDCIFRQSYTGDIINDILGGDPMVHWGFTAATGGVGNEHKVCYSPPIFSALPAMQPLLCAGETITIDALEDYSTLQYLWTPPIGISDATLAHPAFTPLDTTTYFVTIRDECGIIVHTDSTCIPVVNALDVTISPPFENFCEGTPMPLVATATPFSNIVSYTWTNGTEQALTNVTTGGIHTVVASYANCFGEASVDVNYLPFPEINLGADTTLCDGQTTLLIGDSNLSNTAYQWQDGSILPQFEVETAGDYSVTLNAAGCTASDTINVTYLPQPMVNLGEDTAICTGDSLVIDATFIFSSADYLWQDGHTAAIYTISQQGSYDVLVDANGCVGRDTIVVNLLPVPNINLGADFSLCDGQFTNLDAQVNIPNTNYLWQDGSTETTFYVNEAGTYTVYAEAAGCTDNDTVQITYLPQPMVDLGEDTAICTGDSLVIDATFIFSSADYLWQDGHTTATYTISQQGSYDVLVDANGCVDRDTIVVNLLPVPNINLGTDFSLCNGMFTTLDAQVNIPNTNYLWQDGSTETTFYVNEAGTYAVYAETAGCTDNDTVHISYLPQPNINLGGDTTLCEEEDLLLDAFFDENEADYIWQDSSQSSDFLVTSEGTYTVMIDAQGCTDTDTIIIEYIPYTFGERYGFFDTLFCAEQQNKTINANQFNAETYLWNDGTASPLFLVPSEGSFNLTIGTATTCPSTIFYDVEYERCPCTAWFPNVFSPNYDGINDTFQPYLNCSKGEVTDYSLRIFNRWGMLVFNSTNSTDQWTGTFNGQNLTEGVYMYIVKYTLNTSYGTSEYISTSGDISIIR